MHGLWRKKPDNGDRSTRSIHYKYYQLFTTYNLVVQALQLLEYLIKHGSERVVDDARSHVSTIKMLRNFHYIDDKGKDEGINGTLEINKFLVSCLIQALIQSGTALVKSWSCSPMSKKSVQNVGRPRPINTNTLERATMVLVVGCHSQLEAADMVGLEVIVQVVVAVEAMGMVNILLVLICQVLKLILM